MLSQAESELKSKGKEGGKLEEATRIMLNIFRITHSDRSSDHSSKQWGTLYVVNNIFKIYFQVRHRHRDLLISVN